MTDNAGEIKRVKIKNKKPPNPLFQKWLVEWRDDAAQKGSENMQHCFGRALKSLQKYPFTLYSGKECIILENFGVKVCQMIDKKLEEHNAAHSKAANTNSDSAVNTLPHNANEDGVNMDIKKRKLSNDSLARKKVARDESLSSPKKSDEKKRAYVPAYRSGGYAILFTLFQKTSDNNFQGSMTKSEIEAAAQEHCDAPFGKPKLGTFYTAWSSMATLIKRGFVFKKGNPPRFSLTESGIDLAIHIQINTNGDEKLRKDDDELSKPSSSTNMPVPGYLSPEKKEKPVKRPRALKKNNAKSVNDLLQEETEPDANAESQSSEQETIFLVPGTFQIVLLVDTQETDNKLKQNNDATIRQLKSRQVNFEVRHLKVGDFAWISKDGNGNELVLPYVVERKRLDDLAGSIKDGRFHEQKFRLKQCGIQKLIYLVEKYGSDNQRLGLPLPTLYQATANTQIVDGFDVKITNNHDDSMRYLSCMTTLLSNIFKDKTLMSCKKQDLPPVNISEDCISLMSFSEFNKGSGKIRKFNARDMLVKHLLQLKGLSYEKALALIQRYPTVSRLMNALKEANSEKTIAAVSYGALGRSVGPVIAKSIHQLYTMPQLK